MTFYLIFTTYTRNGFKKLQCEQTLYTMRNWFNFDKRQVFKCWKYSERNNRIDNISSHRRCSVTKSVLRNFSKFTGKHLCQILSFNKVAGLLFNKVVGLRPATLLKNRLWHRCFPVNFCEISKNTFCYRTPPVAASVYCRRKVAAVKTENLKAFIIKYYGISKTYSVQFHSVNLSYFYFSIHDFQSSRLHKLKNTH